MTTIHLPALAGPATPLPCLPTEDLDRAKSFAQNDKAEATCAAYRSAFAAFQRWCATRRIASLPAAPETVVSYLAA